MGECESDPLAFICHPFARPPEMKRALAERVASTRRHLLDELLHTNQGLAFRSIAELAVQPASYLQRSQRSKQPIKSSHWRNTSTARPRLRNHQYSKLVQGSLGGGVSGFVHGSASESKADDNIAVCIAGALRTFLQPVVQDSFARQLHRNGYEYFVCGASPNFARCKLLAFACSPSIEPFLQLYPHRLVVNSTPGEH